jgi:hypothetical protein
MSLSPFPLDLADPSRFHAQPREASTGREQGHGDRNDSDGDLSLGKAGQRDNDCQHADGKQKEPGRLDAALHGFAGAWSGGSVMVDWVARGVSHADRLPGSCSVKTAQV